MQIAHAQGNFTKKHMCFLPEIPLAGSYFTYVIWQKSVIFGMCPQFKITHVFFVTSSFHWGGRLERIHPRRAGTKSYHGT
jgi:hypothetical protein